LYAARAATTKEQPMDGELLVVFGLIGAAVLAAMLGLVSLWRRRHRHRHHDGEEIYSHVAASADPHHGLDPQPPPT
jgi:hypothetical protein